MPRPAPVTSAILPSSRNALSADFAGIGFQQAPYRWARFFTPAAVNWSELGAEAVEIGRIDRHASACELFGPSGVDLLNVLPLKQCEFLGIAFDAVLDFRGQCPPRSSVGQQRETRPPMRGQAQISLHFVKL